MVDVVGDQSDGYNDYDNVEFVKERTECVPVLPQIIADIGEYSGPQERADKSIECKSGDVHLKHPGR